MAGNSFGKALVATTFGESHGAALGCVVDGCPAGIELNVEQLQAQLDRRRPGQNRYQSQRGEGDRARILSGVYQGQTLGTPIAVLVENSDAKSSDYKDLAEHYRPGHADFTWDQRFGRRDPRGGGRASARETIGRVAAGAIAEAILDAWAKRSARPPLQIVAWVQQLGSVVAAGPAPEQILPGQTAGYAIDPLSLSREQVDASPLRCPDPQAHERMQEELEQAQRERDSLGGVVRCVVRGLPPGWGEPVFDKLTGMLGHALLSLPAARGVQFGAGFAAASMRGSVHNDAFLPDFHFASNHHGGVLGGISTGAPLVVDVAFKPPATIPQPQQGSTSFGQVAERTVTGRHDPSVVARAVPIVEAAVAFVLADALLAGFAKGAS